ncbi:adenylate cyclase [Gordonia hirsuta DSM 44140 = NBRC 16056]|uniref:Adenylate cyclase n=1 Tax=Gordonia hirsuta DSM 44140 = NBRC 16056 TaxID=1121927 RepID=L7LCC9_9ACTN|nr:adenylate/guanylate cyclase domain-containing protein [Gordonia hirsuta]GAC58785.1 adenylate cyclase [Gordonia hirsuta DSM 44140 = NBRC 16056]
MHLQRTRALLHAIADRLDALTMRPWVGAVLDDHGELSVSERLAVDAPLRRRVLRRVAIGGLGTGLGSNLLIGAEIFVLVLLSYTGGRLTLHTAVSHPAFGDMLVAVLVSIAVSMAAAVALLRPDFRWFLSGAPADAARRRSVGQIPVRQVSADLLGWLFGFAVYALLAGGDGRFLVIVGGAFALSAVTSCSLTYLIAEAAARPLAVLAMRGTSEPRVVHGVRERMIVVWIVSSAVPMVGLIAINFGRRLDWLPSASGPVDWAAVVLALVALGSSLAVVRLVGRAIADPLTEMREVIESAADGDLSRRVAVYDSSELGVLQNGLNDMLDGLTERERIRSLFAKHVGHRVAELAIAGMDEMSGTNTEVAVIFVDLTGSTSFAAQRDPRETAMVLNVFFSVVAKVVQEHEGLINKFEGDASLIIFGAPQPLADPAGTALRAARELGEALGEAVPLEWGMGVSYGRVFAGNIGAANRYEYTVIGDSVNEAARLSDRAKEGVAPIYASGSALAAAPADEAQQWQSVERVRLRGRPEETQVYVPAALARRPAPPTLGSVLGELMKLPAWRLR